ncbi:hypothetical protein EMIT0P294_30529 [Pseudomonas sp. IT-P294]
MTGGFAAGQQVQISHRKIALFEYLHERFADSTGGADHGNIKGLAHGSTSGETGGAALYRVVGAQAIHPHPDRSHALRGNAAKDAPRSACASDAERHGMHSHAERGNDR